MQAALEGQGVALGWNLLTDDLLASGKLVRPLAATMRSRLGFYFLIANGRRSAEVLAFRDWLLEQLGLPLLP